MEKLEVIEIENEIERLNREWEMVKERHTTIDKNGNRRLPSRKRSWFGAAVGVAVGIIWLVVHSSIGSPFALYYLPPILFIVMSIVWGIASSLDAERFSHIENSYEWRRTQLLNSLIEARRSSQPP